MIITTNYIKVSRDKEPKLKQLNVFPTENIIPLINIAQTNAGDNTLQIYQTDYSYSVLAYKWFVDELYANVFKDIPKDIVNRFLEKVSFFREEYFITNIYRNKNFKQLKEFRNIHDRIREFKSICESIFTLFLEFRVRQYNVDQTSLSDRYFYLQVRTFNSIRKIFFSRNTMQGAFEVFGTNFLVVPTFLAVKTDQGHYPILFLGCYRENVKTFCESSMSSNIEVYKENLKLFIDKDFYLNYRPNLIKRIIEEILEKNFRPEIVLIDGKEFAKKNMFVYKILLPKSLVERKNLFSQMLYRTFSKIINPTNRELRKKMKDKLFEDYNSTKEYFNQLAKSLEQKKAEKTEEENHVVAEEVQLSAADMADLIRMSDFITQLSSGEDVLPPILLDPVSRPTSSDFFEESESPFAQEPIQN